AQALQHKILKISGPLVFDMLNRCFSRVAFSHLRNSVSGHWQIPVMSKYCTTALFIDEKQTQLYAKFRPHYTPEIYERIVKFCEEGHCDFDLAIDVGCGSGQSTQPLSKYFKQVIGVDVSENQLANVPKNIHNVTFRVGAAENLSFVQPETVDLVTVAQALHWLDFGKFFAEVYRILKPGGSFVTYGYGVCKLEPEEANKVFSHFYGDVLGDYWPEGRKIVEERYTSIVLPFPEWQRDDSLNIVKECTVEEFLGYMGSWSAVNGYSKAHPSENLLDQAQQRLKLCIVDSSSPKPIKVTWPVFMLMGHKPVCS
ncbi:hypothetical protein Btru_029454, partial [Bulinus truncatus]